MELKDKLIHIIKSSLGGWVLMHIAERIAPIIADELIRLGIVKEE